MKEGLSSNEAKELLSKHGPNKLPEKPPPSALVIFARQLKNPLVYVLLAAAGVTFTIGHTSDTLIIGVAVALNTLLGFIQESRAGKALQALKKLLHPITKVIRDGKQIKVGVETVVPGDICILGAGDKIPADGRLVFSNRFQVDEAILTGESIPATKAASDKVLMGTIVSAGRAKLLVENTGAKTQIGRIAQSVQVEESTPLKRQLTKFSRGLSILVIVLVVVVFAVGFLAGRDLIEIFTTSVALAVSAIPEGLLVGLTVVLAIGMQRIAKRKGLVRNLVSAETLGGVTTICIDKTGTLTEGKMKVVQTLGDKDNIAEQLLIANDLDHPIVVAAHVWASSVIADPKSEIKKHKRLDSLPFSSSERYFASLNKWGKSNMLFVNGAPDILLSLSELDKGKKKEIESQIKKLASEGKRLIGLARKKVTSDIINTKDLKNLEWVGIVAMTDPVRSGVKKALEQTRLAGVKTVVITGDYYETAKFVMTELGMEVNKKTLYARTTPDEKLEIVKKLQSEGEVVAMMGDGVNDAPALAAADIGIVVGSATDVARESSDLVLLDSSYETIVAAIEEGRGVYENIRKIIMYLMSDAFEEIVAVMGALLLGISTPVTAVQILWINLVSDGLPNLALTVDPIRSGIMKERPRSSKDSIVAGWMKRLIVLVSLAGGIMALSLFIYTLKTSGNLTLARSIAFATLGVNSLVYVFSVRTLTQPFWKTNPFANKWLNVAVVAGLGIQVGPFLSSTTRGFFGLEVLNIGQWLLVFAASAVMLIIIETGKLLLNK